MFIDEPIESQYFKTLPYISIGRAVQYSTDGNSICEEVVLTSFNKASWDEDNILDQIYRSKYIRIIIVMILFLYSYSII